MIVMGIEEFTAKRRISQSKLEALLLPLVKAALEKLGHRHWDDALLAEVLAQFKAAFLHEGGVGTPPRLAQFMAEVRRTLSKTENPNDQTPITIATWLATAILNAATVAAADTDSEPLTLTWVTMHDTHVRETHVEARGQVQLVGEKFDVGGEKMRYPGDPRVSIALWINCRCSLAPGHINEAALVAAQEELMDDTMIGPLAWHGVLAPEGVWSGDGRMFAENSLRFRDLPLPLTWQKASSDGHGGSVVVAKIEQIARVGNEMRAAGSFMMTPEADEAVGLLAEFGKFGVSVDADDAEFEFNEDNNKTTFTSARIASASMVAIPAFGEAYVALGAWAEGEMPQDALAASNSEYAWDGSASRFTPEEWKASCVLHLADTLNKSDHKLPIKEPSGTLNPGGVHAAAARFNQVDAPAEAKAKAKASLRGAYKTLGEEVPDVLKASAETFGRGPGWITDPVATKRIHDYWTVPGEPGYEKVAWGTEGDFNRCRVELGEEIGENSPDKLRFLNQICAQWQHDAIGIWPGKNEKASDVTMDYAMAPALTLVAGNGWCAPSEWFRDPELTRETPVTVTEEGRVFGHLATWKTCHTAYKDTCVAPPRSASNYAYFLTGEVMTEGGGVPVGQLTIGGGHASHNASARAAVAHYDSTSSVVADVTCGEDDHGIWVAGWVRPGVSDEQVMALRASSLSGDWRRIAGEMELVAALAVNSPGFPVPRVGIAAAQQVSLVAAGVVEEPSSDPVQAIAEAVAEAIENRAKRREKMLALAARVRGD